MRKLILIIVFLPLLSLAQKQTYTLKETGFFPDSLISLKGEGKIILHQDKKLTDIINNYKLAYAKKKIKGWRVQIYFVSGVNASQKAKNVMNKFKTQFPDVPAYLEYEEPFFKVRVGDFITRLEAAKFKRTLQEKGYNKVFLVEEEINF